MGVLINFHTTSSYSSYYVDLPAPGPDIVWFYNCNPLKHMVRILDGNSEIGAQVRSNIC